MIQDPINRGPLIDSYLAPKEKSAVVGPVPPFALFSIDALTLFGTSLLHKKLPP